jgi:hypothetical protein
MFNPCQRLVLCQSSTETNIWLTYCSTYFGVLSSLSHHQCTRTTCENGSPSFFTSGCFFFLTETLSLLLNIFTFNPIFIAQIMTDEFFRSSSFNNVQAPIIRAQANASLTCSECNKSNSIKSYNSL